MHEHDRLDQLLEQLVRTEQAPDPALQQTVVNRIHRRHRVIQWMVILSLVLNAGLFLAMIAAPLAPGLSWTGRMVILALESICGSAVILALLAARDRVGAALTRMELLITINKPGGIK